MWRQPRFTQTDGAVVAYYYFIFEIAVETESDPRARDAVEAARDGLGSSPEAGGRAARRAEREARGWFLARPTAARRGRQAAAGEEEEAAQCGRVSFNSVS